MSEIKELPEGWKWVKLGVVCKLKNGFAFKSSEYKNHGIPVIRISDIQSGAVKPEKSIYVSSNKEYDLFQIYNSDILVAMSGATTGKFGIYKSNTKAYQNQRVGKFQILNPELLDNNFLLYQLGSLKRKIERDAYGGAQPNISSGKIEALNIVLPPFALQKIIVSKIEELFSDLDKGVENLKLAQQQLKTYRQSVLKWAFEGKLTNRNIIDEEPTSVWTWVSLKDICDIKGGVTKGKDLKGEKSVFLPYLRVANVQDGYLNLKEIKTIEVLQSDMKKYKLEFGDILYTEGGDKDKLGRGTIWKDEIQDCIHQNHIFRARPLSGEINSKFVAYYSRTQKAKNYFFKNGKQTTNLASINLTILSNLAIPFCPKSESEKVVQEIESRLSIIEKIDKSINESLLQSEILKQSILKKAFEGMLI